MLFTTLPLSQVLLVYGTVAVAIILTICRLVQYMRIKQRDSDYARILGIGLKKTTLQDWIEIDDTYMQRYQQKSKLFETKREDVFRATADAWEPAVESLHLLRDLLIRRYPHMFRLRDGKNTIENLVTGDSFDLSPSALRAQGRHPLEIMGLLATEDFFVLTTDAEGQTSLRGGAVCFPAGWKIEERVGLSLWQIHAGKVPQYEEKLAKSMDRFFVKLKAGEPIARFNYAIDDSEALFRRHGHHNLTPEQLGKAIALTDLHLRVERQVLQRLPKTGALLFTIRTYVTPLTQVTKDKEITRALRTTIDSYDETMSSYKNKQLWNSIFQKHVAEVLGETTETH
ncbi:unnamed protein product [Clonostachys rosea]|uniref:DUF3445 domain-containing protein n=1 Tax=Bionectria ochroleuca TaxID=29856 RepID=A0ABY6TP64_BIOOC|nr:unnamed protein product [Clonostachys rosea]